MDVSPHVGSLAGIENALVLQRQADEVGKRRGDGLVRARSTTEYDSGAYDGGGDFTCQIRASNPVVSISARGTPRHQIHDLSSLFPEVLPWRDVEKNS